MPVSDAVVLEVYLGANVRRMAAALSDRLQSGGQPVDFDVTASAEERMGRIESGEADLMWMCGHLSIQMLDAGALDAEIVAAPVFAGETSATYHSVLVVGPHVNAATVAELSGATVAFNQADSWSGWLALQSHLHAAGLDVGMFGTAVESGAHDASLELLVDGKADLAAIDHTIFDDWAATRPDHPLRVLGRTQDWPSPPLLLSRRFTGHRRENAVQTLLTAAAGGALEDVGLRSLVLATGAVYEVMRSVSRH